MKLVRLAISLLSITVTGCAITNEGKVDFRRTVDTEIRSNLGSCPSSKLLPLKVKNCSLGENVAFSKGDTLSLHLRSAFIKDFSENIMTPFATSAFNRQWGKPVGEIAIVANAFEEINGKELSFNNMRDGRLVFYSNNVHKGQLINFDNMPIYGPLPYNGAPFAFRVAIFELDVVSAQAKVMLSTVAQAGAKAYPPASPVLEVLNGIGDSFLTGDKNDTEFRYSVVFDPKGGVKEINHLRLEAGNYAFVRVENREAEVPWDKIELNENEGKLYWKDNHDEDPEPDLYTDNTYLIVEINKNVSDLTVELAQNNLGGLITALQGEDKQKATAWDSANKVIFDVAIQRAQIINFSRAKEILVSLRPTATSISKPEKRVMAKELMTMVANSVADGGKTLAIDPSNKDSQAYALSDQQIKYVLKEARDIAKGSLNSDGKLELLGTMKIKEAFNAAGISAKQKMILDLIAPL